MKSETEGASAPENLDDESSPSLAWALLPVALLLTLLISALILFGDDTVGGPAQVVLLIAGLGAALVGRLHGVPWIRLERAAVTTVASATMSMLILLSIGGLIGVWMAAGIIPTLIHLGSQLLSPSIFYLASLLIAAIVSLVVGSSWTTVATVGVALIGVALAAGLSLPMTAGALISGAYFGDKLSPLSDTTNLAAGLAGTELFTHVRYMLWTTVPAFIAAALFFGVASLGAGGDADAKGLAAMNEALEANFNTTWLLLLPLLIMVGMAMAGVPALVSILASILVGALFGVALQPLPEGVSGGAELLRHYWGIVANGFEIQTGVAVADELLSRGGMASMLTTLWLIIAAMFFSGMLERSGCLARILLSILGLFRRRGAILYGVGATSLATNILAADQYLSLVLSSRMYADEVDERGLKPETLSRTVEDFGTVTSPLVPWNTCGAYMAATLGVATWAYLPYCIFNLVSPLVSLFYIASGKTIRWQAGQEPPEAKALAAAG